MIIVRKIFYRGSKYWLLQIEDGRTIGERVVKIDGSRWSRTKNGWLLPGTAKAWTAFKDRFEKEEYQIERAYFSPKLSGHKVTIKVEVMPMDSSRLIVRLRKFTKSHLDGIRKVSGGRYHPELRYWSVPNSEEGMWELRLYLGDLIEVV